MSSREVSHLDGKKGGRDDGERMRKLATARRSPKKMLGPGTAGMPATRRSMPMASRVNCFEDRSLSHSTQVVGHVARGSITLAFRCTLVRICHNALEHGP